MNLVLEKLEKVFQSGDIICVAVSGGIDSMVLLTILVGLRDKIDIDVIVMNVDHGVRIESKLDSLFVENFCVDRNIKFYGTKFDISNVDNFHSLARNMRYKFFDDVLKKEGAKYLITAHHNDDLLETILMRMIRGSSLLGYAGFEEFDNRDNYILYRPLINSTKREIQEYASLKGIDYVQDNSNNSDKYTRNRVRKNLVGILKDEGMGVEKVIQFKNSISLVGKYIEKEVEKAYIDVVINEKISVDKFVSLDDFMKVEVLKKYLLCIYKDNIKIINNKHVKILEDFIIGNYDDKMIDFPKGYLLLNEDCYVFAIKKKINSFACKELVNKDVNIFDKFSFEFLNECESGDNSVIKLNSLEVKLPLYVRTVKPGDKINVKGMTGRKLVNRIFIDEGVNKRKRENFLILVDSEENILWVPTIKKSIFDKHNIGKYDIIIKCNWEEK